MNFFLRTLPFLAFFVLFAFALYLAGSGDQIGPAFVPGAYALVVAAGLSFGVVVGLLLKRSIGLYRDWRNAEPGAGLRLRLFALLLLLTIPPWILLGFSLRFLNTTIDSWFRVEVEQALVAASEVAKDALRAERTRALERATGIADSLVVLDVNAELNDALDRSGALQLSVFDERGESLASASADTRFLLPRSPTSSERERASTEPFCDLEGEGSSDGLTLRVLRPLAGGRWLEARFAPAQNWAERANLIETQVNDYKKLKYLRNALKTTLFIVLSVVLLLGALVALYMAFAISKRVVAPLTNLVAANRRVAAGDYSARVSEGGATELSLLARSFNQMSGDLERANVQAQRSGVQAMADRSFLETVLERIRSGVLILEGEKLKSANVSAAELLEVPLSAMLGKDLLALGKAQPRLAPLTEMLLMHARTQAREWRAEIALDAALGKQLILLRGARLPDGAGGESGGQVVIADDEGDVARTQRESAWSEVARRLAHEIKNPLTPIQLAAERLRRKYLTTLPESDRDVLDRATHTIVAQVESLKTMVNAFSDYSRPPQLQMLGVDMPALAYEVAELYASESQKVSFVFDFDGVRSAPKLRADSGRLRQLLHNLIKNAQEASEGKPVSIQLSATAVIEGSSHWYELSVADNGPGLPSALRERLFEPYTTSKTKGTGLGLAIVKKIAEEHGGSVRADAKKEGGAVFRVRFPLNV